MEEKLKQRLVGAMVLIAVAVIFLPSLFHQDERVKVDTTSLIPPKPSVEPIVITRPIKSSNVQPAPTPDVAFQPPVNLDDLPDPKPVLDKPVSTDNVVAKANKSPVVKPKVKPEVTKPKVTKPKVTKPKVTKSKVTKPNKAAPAPKPSLNQQGLPQSWVVQVASFQSKERALSLTKKLLAKDYKAYERSINTEKGTFYRVFVGPYIDKGRAESSKRKIDKAHKVSSRVLTFSAE